MTRMNRANANVSVRGLHIPVIVIVEARQVIRLTERLNRLSKDRQEFYRDYTVT